MIRLGCYDAFDKWEIICRAWAGQSFADVGLDRHGRPKLPEWQRLAFAGGRDDCHRYIRLKCDALGAGGGGTADEIAASLFQLLEQIGYAELRDRCFEFVETIKSAGMAAESADIPPLVADRIKEVFKIGALLALRWTDDPDEIPDIDVLRANKREFPAEFIKGKRNVLDLFCAREYGVLDAIHVHDICPDHVTLVDFDKECLEVMQRIYPTEWTYIHADYKEFLREAEQRNLIYDLIVADPWRSMCVEVGFEMLATIMARCSDMFVCHYVQEMFDELAADREDYPGLSSAIRRRTGVDVEVIHWVQRGAQNGCLVMRKRG